MKKFLARFGKPRFFNIFRPIWPDFGPDFRGEGVEMAKNCSPIFFTEFRVDYENRIGFSVARAVPEIFAFENGPFSGGSHNYSCFL